MDGVLIICSACESPLIQAESWNQSEGGTWEVVLRCPECGHVDSGLFDAYAVSWLHEALDRGGDLLREAVARAERVAMAEWADRFVAALQADAVFPSDFGTPR